MIICSANDGWDSQVLVTRTNGESDVGANGHCTAVQYHPKA